MSTAEDERKIEESHVTWVKNRIKEMKAQEEEEDTVGADDADRLSEESDDGSQAPAYTDGPSDRDVSPCSEDASAPVGEAQSRGTCRESDS